MIKLLKPQDMAGLMEQLMPEMGDEMGGAM
jgi:hypothetical protein